MLTLTLTQFPCLGMELLPLSHSRQENKARIIGFIEDKAWNLQEETPWKCSVTLLHPGVQEK